MKILYLITALGVGGAENLLVDICSNLRERHDITVGFFRDDNRYVEALEKMGISVIHFTYRSFRHFIPTVWRVRGIVRKGRYDIIHTHLPLADSIGRIAGLMVPGVQIITTIHNSDLWKMQRSLPLLGIRIFNCVSVNLFRRARLIAVSESVKNYIMNWEWIRGAKITVVYNFINYDNPEKTQYGFIPDFERPRHFVMVCIARHEENKGHIFLFRAMEALVRDPQFAHVRLVLLGTGTREGFLKEYVREKGMEDYILFTGNRKNVYDYLKNADLFVLASQNEGMSIAMIEAFYCGTPVLASDIEANVELLQEGRNGILFNYGDDGDLCRKIRSFALGRYDIATLTRNAYIFSQTFSRHRHIVLLESVMRKKEKGKSG